MAAATLERRRALHPPKSFDRGERRFAKLALTQRCCLARSATAQRRFRRRPSKSTTHWRRDSTARRTASAARCPERVWPKVRRGQRRGRKTSASSLIPRCPDEIGPL